MKLDRIGGGLSTLRKLLSTCFGDVVKLLLTLD